MRVQYVHQIHSQIIASKHVVFAPKQQLTVIQENVENELAFSMPVVLILAMVVLHVSLSLSLPPQTDARLLYAVQLLRAQRWGGITPTGGSVIGSGSGSGAGSGSGSNANGLMGRIVKRRLRVALHNGRCAVAPPQTLALQYAPASSSSSSSSSSSADDTNAYDELTAGAANMQIATAGFVRGLSCFGFSFFVKTHIIVSNGLIRLSSFRHLVFCIDTVCQQPVDCALL